MQERPEGNHEFDNRTIFEVSNQYFLLFFALCCLLSSVFIQEIFWSIEQFRLGISVAPLVGIILPVFLLTRRFKSGLRPQLRIGPIQTATAFYVILATITMVVVVDHAYVFSQKFMPAPDGYLEGLKELKPEGFWPTLLTFAGLCLVVPFSEELVFRGIIQRVFHRNMGGVPSIVLAGVFFGVIHLNPQLLLAMTCFGVFVGFIFFVTSNLSYAMLAHAALNTIAFLQLALEPAEAIHVAPFYVEDWWYLVLALGILGLLLWKIKTGATPIAPTPLGLPEDSKKR
jgi:membrane protease YdiL (CAAX protease family)